MSLILHFWGGWEELICPIISLSVLCLFWDYLYWGRSSEQVSLLLHPFASSLPFKPLTFRVSILSGLQRVKSFIGELWMSLIQVWGDEIVICQMSGTFRGKRCVCSLQSPSKCPFTAAATQRIKARQCWYKLRKIGEIGKWSQLAYWWHALGYRSTLQKSEWC